MKKLRLGAISFDHPHQYAWVGAALDLPMVELVAATGLSRTPAYPCRFDPRAVDAKRRIEAGDIGRILAMHATNHLKKTPEGWFVDPQLSGGGTIMDHIVHGMDLMRWFGGREVVEIYAEAATLARPGLGVDDVAMLVLAFDGGAIGSCDPSWNRPLKSVSWGDVSVRILGTKGALEFDLTGQYFTRMLDAGEEGGVVQVQFGDNMNELLMKEFAEAVLAGRKPPVTDVDGWQGVACIEAAYKSARTHRVVGVARFPAT